MLRKRGRPKESRDVEKINPVNVHIPTPIPANEVYEEGGEVNFKCDTPRCRSKAEIFLNLKYCKLCAQDKGF